MRYVRPDESLLGAPVSGSVDADYTANWLTDGRPSFPVRVTGTLNLTVTPGGSPDPMVDVIALCHHNIQQAATITLGGSLSGGITTAPVLADGIPFNLYRILDSPVSVNTLVLGVSGNSVPVVIGYLFAGLSRTSTPLHLGRAVTQSEPFAWEGETLTQAPYDPGLADARRISGECILTDTELAAVQAWYASTRRGTRPTLIIPDENVNDAWLAVFRYASQDLGPNTYPGALHQVTFEFVEVPRVRW